MLLIPLVKVLSVRPKDTGQKGVRRYTKLLNSTLTEGCAITLRVAHTHTHTQIFCLIAMTIKATKELNMSRKQKMREERNLGWWIAGTPGS